MGQQEKITHDHKDLIQRIEQVLLVNCEYHNHIQDVIFTQLPTATPVSTKEPTLTHNSLLIMIVRNNSNYENV